METAEIAFLILLIVAGAALAFRHWMRLNATAKAAEVTREVYPVWAAQGPFDSGAQSAAAMRYAYVVVRGPDEAEHMSEAIARHAQAFDAHPGTWEKLRQNSLSLAGLKTQDHITIAKGLAAADSLNKDLFEAGGYKIEFASQPDGRVSFANKQIWSDEEVQRQKESRAEIIYKSVGTSLLEDSSADGHRLVQFLKKKASDAEAITKSIGTSLLEDSSAEGRLRVQFLIEIHRSNAEHGPETPMALGKLWMACVSFSQENPDSDIAKEFTVLNHASSATKPELEN